MNTHLPQVFRLRLATHLIVLFILFRCVAADEAGSQSVRSHTIKPLPELSSLELYNTIRFVPEFFGGEVVGYRIDYLDPKSPIACMGFESGDVILSLNGKELGEMSNLLPVGKPSQLHRATIKKRNGSVAIYEYRHDPTGTCVAER